MLNKVSVSSLNSNVLPHKERKNNPSFNGGLGDLALAAVQACETNPMINVAALDVITAIGPRTVIESKTNAHAGFEAFRRESSGLLVNCLIPGFAVWGLAGLLSKPIMGPFKNTNFASCWANDESIKAVSEHFLNAVGNTPKEKVSNTIRNLLHSIEGVDGNDIKKFKDFDLEKGIEKLTDAVFSQKPKKAIKEAYKSLIETTRIGENIKVGGASKFFSKNLEGLVDDTGRLLKGFVEKNATDKNTMADLVKRSKKLVNWKSFGGMALIIPLAISMQSINRWITHKTSGKKGAPIYKDYGKTEQKAMTAKEKAELFAQKLISAGSMIGVAFMSMGFKLPSLSMLQFKGKFPSMDQARLISTATFASRMMAAEDKNELKESTIRDIATFSSLYFLGDYAAKGAASIIEKIKPDVKLLNRAQLADKNAGMMKKAWNWVKHTSLKSSDEVATPLAKKMRSVCQLSNLGFSLLLLGIFIPLLTRHQTNKKHKADLLKAQNNKTGFEFFLKNFSPTFQQFTGK